MNTFCNTRIEETKTERKQTCTWLFLGKNKIPLTKHYFGRNTDKFIVTEYDKKKNFIDPRRKIWVPHHQAQDSRTVNSSRDKS